MKERLKLVWNSRPRMGRRLQTACFLILAAFFLCELWGYAGYPLPTAELEFRRLERQYLAETKGEPVEFSVGEVDYIGALDGKRFNLCVLEDGWLKSLRVPEGGALLPVYKDRWYTGEYAFLLVGGPEDTESAQLRLELSAGSYESIRDDLVTLRVFLELPHDDPGMKGIYRSHHWQYTSEGEKLEDGIFLFRITPQGDLWAETADAEDVAEEHALFYISRLENYKRAQEGRPQNADFRAEVVCYHGGRETDSLSLTLLTKILA